LDEYISAIVCVFLLKGFCKSHINFPTGVAGKIDKIKLFKYMIGQTGTRMLIPKFMKIVCKKCVDKI
jgi:hypothetical protein